MHELKAFFGCGGVYINRRHDNHKEHLYRYDVRAPRDLLGRIIPFFQSHPLRTAKAEDYRKWVAVVRMMEQGRHRSVDGMFHLATIVQTMNSRNRLVSWNPQRPYASRLSLDGRVEDMVLAPRRRGGS